MLLLGYEYENTDLRVDLEQATLKKNAPFDQLK